MKFFVPHADGPQEAESVYSSIANFVGASSPHEHERRIFSLSWQHNARSMQAEVGKPLPDYFELGIEPVLAIFDAGTHFKICTPSRGGVLGDPVLAGGRGTRATYFEGGRIEPRKFRTACKYSCTNGHSGTPSETQAYYERHSKD